MSKPEAISDEKDLVLTGFQFKQLREIWFALEELSDLIPPAGNETEGLFCLKVLGQRFADVLRDIKGEDLI